jgi:KAP family P-loop domain
MQRRDRRKTNRSDQPARRGRHDAGASDVDPPQSMPDDRAMHRLLDDNPATTDLLGFDRFESILYRVLRDPPRLPFTLGIFGEWGSGKTTLMKMIQRRLDHEGVKTVWFNAWKYDSKENIWNALIQTIFHTMRMDAEATSGQRGKDFAKRVERAAVNLARYAAKVATRLVPGGVLREEDVDAVLDAVSSSATDELFEFINRFEDEFNELVTEYVGDDRFLAIFIDDLDRCLPENAINVMEALKLYLDRGNCIFVIGAESGVIEEGIRQRYQGNVRLSAVDYLDKIIQLPFVLPQIGDTAAERLLAEREGMTLHEDPLMRAMIIAGTDGNPRRVKRFANSYTVLAQIAGELPLDDQRRLAKVLMLQMRFPDVFNMLAEQPNLAEEMTVALNEGPAAVSRQKELGGAGTSALYDDTDLRRFLMVTSEIRTEEAQIDRWIRLTAVTAPLSRT